MTKGTQLWPGDKMRAFFLAHVRRETTLDAQGAERLADALTRAINRMLVWEMPAAEPVDRPSVPEARDISKTETAAPFNPFAFSATVTFAKHGPAALMTRLSDITNIDHLRALARAQHLAVDAEIASAEEFRRAIVAAAEQRLADRKAAAS